MNKLIGSIWNKWDLHIHTPFSFEQHYGGNNEETWEKFICDLESLPPEFKVIGINDYLFIDGYERVLEYKENGRLKNIELILPVVEFRIDKFGGTDTHWKKVNFHVIFADKKRIDPDIIRGQFLNTIYQEYKLSPDFEGIVTWNGTPTRSSLEDLGKSIIDTVPEDKKKDFKSPLMVGFENLNYNYGKLIEKLRENSYYLGGNYFTAIGKAEWESLRWDDHSIAEKKNVINKSDFVFTSSNNPRSLLNAKEKLTIQSVNDKLLDCSDAHYFSESSEKDRIGKCFTWIKADTSFEGLRQVIFEPERIFLGETPIKIPYVEKNKTKFIKKLEIKKNAGAILKEKWFDSEIEFNKDLIAIIGNKGSGKSALLDIIGMMGNSKVDKRHFPFLNQDQFLREGKAKNFSANLTWESNDTSGFKNLDIECETEKEELVRYIPQNYFEEICTQLSQTTEKSGFYHELSKVIFSHVKVADRLGKEDIDQLISHHKEEIDDAIKHFELKLDSINEEIIELEYKAKLEYKQGLENKISQKKKELSSLVQPTKVKKPTQDDPEITKKSSEIETLKTKLDEIEKQTEEFSEEYRKINLRYVDLEKLKRKIENFYRAYEDLLSDLNQEQKDLVDKTLNFSVDFDVIKEEISKIEEKRITKSEEIKKANDEIQSLKIQLDELQKELDKPNRDYQDFLNKQESWESQKKEIVGNTETPGTVKFYEKQLDELKNIDTQLSKVKDERKKISKEIFNKKLEISSIYGRLYSPVQEFIESQELGDEFNLQFSVSVEIEKFHDLFFSYISHGCSGTFYRVEDGKKKLTDIINSYEFNNSEEVEKFVEQIIDNVSYDRRPGKGEKVNIEDQLLGEKTKLDFYNFIFGLKYLIPRFVLKLGDKDIQLLSPGEKGTLLLVFYLLIDQDKIPLLIDQPEHNLDNQTVFKLLVNCVKKAKQKRQIFIVTHNPNLAVVCDAEQIICTRIDKTTNNEVFYDTGAIENPKINKMIIDILEGTKIAFNQRRFKYLLDQYDKI